MSKNGDGDSDYRVVVDENIANIPDDQIDHRKFSSTMMYHVPEAMRPNVQKLLTEIARVNSKLPIPRRAEHNPIVQEQRETCMYENCDKLTTGKCGRCHVFLCIDSKNNCFKKFHESDQTKM